MRRKKTYFLFSLLVLMASAFSLHAQTLPSIKIDSIECCPKSDFTFPILINNIRNVDSFNLVLNYDQSVIDYQDYKLLNDSLAITNPFEGEFNIVEQPGILTINWHRNRVFNPTSDSLVFLHFKSLLGNTSLNWDLATAGNCIFHCQGDTILTTSFINSHVKVDPPIHVTLTELNKTCKGKCDANFMAIANGGTPTYQYWWNGKPGRYDSIETNLCDSANLIHIIDSKGCKLDSTFIIDGMPGPIINLIMTCDGVEIVDTLYRQNPVLTFRIETDDAVQPPFEWDFGDGATATTNENSVTHVFSTANTATIKEYILSLKVVNSNGCDSIYKYTIHIKDDSIIKINNVLVPSGTPKNRVFTIADKDDPDWNPLIHQFKYIEVVIFDRWGRKLYSNSDYQCDWKAEGLPDGVYYYVVKIVGYFDTQKHKGSLTIIGSGKK
ncbi:MAG: gliding motility-associated C-terminal domain-containing protein [Bacteroidetes bacterium]|nr:gliding motility-associated C-terminal domain-containing protein [Bacteroidota bacterium]